MGDSPEAVLGSALGRIIAFDERCTAVVLGNRAVFAAHCYHGAPIVSLSGRPTSLTGCATHPDAAIGNGYDIGFCLVAQASFAAAEELDTSPVETGEVVILVGLGEGERLGHTPTVRWGVVSHVSREIVVHFDDGGIQPGDSGGGLFVDRVGKWKLAGIASSSQLKDSDEVARFVPISRLDDMVARSETSETVDLKGMETFQGCMVVMIAIACITIRACIAIRKARRTSMPKPSGRALDDPHEIRALRCSAARVSTID